MSRARVKLPVTGREHKELLQLSIQGSARERKLANAILYLATGKWSYRATKTALKISNTMLNEAVARFRTNRIPGLLQPRRRTGRPTKMDSPIVRRFVAEKLDGAAEQNAQTLVEAIHCRFGIALAPTSLPRWLKKWGLRLPHRRRTIPKRNILPTVESFLNRELDRVGDLLVRTERDHPEWKRDIECLELQRDLILALIKVAEGGYTQATIAEELGRSPATINRWLKRFWSGGASIAMAERMIAIHES